jgi:hypothetical protein
MAEVLVTGAMAHGYEVMRRQTVRYDYEKVFWNSTYGLGLLGLGWIAIKLGWIVSDLQNISAAAAAYVETVKAFMADPVTSIKFSEYKIMWDYIEGAHKDTPSNVLEYPTSEAVQAYRDAPDLWTSYKAEFAATYPQLQFTKEGEPLEKLPVADSGNANAVRILESVDSIYTKYGAAMPIGLLVGNVGIEYLRVFRFKAEMRNE